MNLKKFKANARAVLVSAEMTLRQNAADGFILFAILVQPLITAILALWMLRDKSADNAIFAVVGSGMSGLWSSLLFVCGNSITVERWHGTLESIAAVPTGMSVIVLGKDLANVLQSLISMIVCYAVAVLLFNYHLHVDQPLLFIISLLMTVISFVSFGLIIGPLFLLNPAIQSLQNGLEFPVYILGGFLFPLALLPNWTTPFSYLLTPYWAAQALHLSSSGGGSFADIAFCWGMMLFFSAIYLIASRYLFRAILYRVRVDATLGLQ
jgi:ABC-2 type transport system permease protein